MSIFGWLRKQFSDAVTGGIGDGLHSVGLLDDREAADINAIRLAMAKHLSPERELEALPPIHVNGVPLPEAPVNRVADATGNGKTKARAKA